MTGDGYWCGQLDRFPTHPRQQVERHGSAFVSGFLRHIKAGDGAFEGFCGHPHRFRQGRVGVNRETDIGRVRVLICIQI